MLPAGKRDRYITFEKATPGEPLPSGEPTSVWATYFACWSERRPLQGREFFQAQQVAAKVDVIYRIPYPHGKTVSPHEGLRIVDQGQTFDITYVAELGTRGRAGLEIMATSRAEAAA